ncbi:cell wall hydrolase [Pseudoruegeria sp. HB172150]|uniref:cell wall hydrolase n=1 Tax=Pseudoruegeria sp. HB172150 TaxID=2721164 RepID=UPI001554C99C|nr:cell wall hydrolase [Pseudoruegeria sp. HB172150]
MAFIRLWQAAIIVVAVSFSTVAGAGEVLSESNDPSIQMDERFDDTLGQIVAGTAAEAASLATEYTMAWLDTMPRANGGIQWACLAEALYFEARGESVRGQFAVGEVILNRVERREFPDTVCGVVHQGTGRRNQCQFSYSCDGLAEVFANKAAYVRAGKVARVLMDGAARTLTGGATNFHTPAVSPRWARRFEHTATIGRHLFYRMPLKIASN